MESIVVNKMQLATYPEIDGKNFNNDIFKRREFHVEKDGIEGLNAIQTRLKRYENPRTQYENQLLFHEMGSGKTRSALSIAENAMQTENDFTQHTSPVWVGREWFVGSQSSSGAVIKIVSWNGDQVEVELKPRGNFTAKKKAAWCKARGGCKQFLRRDQVPPIGRHKKIIFVSKTSRFAQEIVEPELEKMYNSTREEVRKHIQKSYSLLGYNQFAEIVKTKPNWLDNSVVIIDEVHNLVPMETGKEDKKKKTRYESIKGALRVAQNRFLVLLTGTPMINTPQEIVWILELMLPSDSKKQPKDMTLKETVQWCENNSQGLVSYLKKVSSAVPMRFLGKTPPQLKHLKVVEVPMQGQQLTQYLRLGKPKDFNTLHRQYGLMAPLDGSEWGELEYKKVKRQIKNNLRHYSAKYAWVLNQLSKPENCPMYVYSNYINGGGIRFLADILRAKGYMPLGPGDQSARPRYLLITGTLVNKKELLKAFNQPGNREGKICKIIIGGPSSIEGFTFKNIRMEIILNPPFSYSAVAQALARGVRARSHDEPRPREVKAVQLVATVPRGPSALSESSRSSTVGVDLEMYQKVEEKDIEIKKIEYVLKKNAWDCAFNKTRNVEGREDYSRECDYKPCDYQCNGVQDGARVDYNTTTWDIYYAPREPVEIEIIKIFKNQTSISVQQLLAMFRGRFSRFLVLTTIDNLLRERQRMPSWYGRPCYLTHAADTLFLTHNILQSAPVLALSQLWYVENPTWYPIAEPLAQPDQPEQKDVARRLRSLLESNSVLGGRQGTQDACPAIGKFPLTVQLKVLTKALVAQRELRGEGHVGVVTREILQYYKPVWYTQKGGDTTVSLLYQFSRPQGQLKILPLQGRVLRDATPEETSRYQERSLRRPKSIYGTQNMSEPGDEWSCAFCLVPREVNIPKELLDVGNREEWDRAWKKYSRQGVVNVAQFKDMFKELQKDFAKPLKATRLKDRARPHKPPWNEKQARRLVEIIGQKGGHQKTVGSNLCADHRLSAKGLIGHLLDLKVKPPTTTRGMNNPPYGKACPTNELNTIPQPLTWTKIKNNAKIWKQVKQLLEMPLVNGKKIRRDTKTMSMVQAVGTHGFEKSIGRIQSLFSHRWKQKHFTRSIAPAS